MNKIHKQSKEHRVNWSNCNINLSKRKCIDLLTRKSMAQSLEAWAFHLKQKEIAFVVEFIMNPSPLIEACNWLPLVTSSGFVKLNIYTLVFTKNGVLAYNPRTSDSGNKLSFYGKIFENNKINSTQSMIG